MSLESSYRLDMPDGDPSGGTKWILGGFWKRLIISSGVIAGKAFDAKDQAARLPRHVI
jgi:hypothetical protein